MVRHPMRGGRKIKTMKKLIVKFDTSLVNSKLTSKPVYSLQMKDRPIYDDDMVFDEVVKEKTLPIDAGLLKFAFVSILTTAVKKVASDCIPRRIANCVKVLPTMRGTVDGPYSPYNPETCSTAIVVQSLSGVEKSVDMGKIQFVNIREGVKAVVKKITWRGAEEPKKLQVGHQIRCTGDFLNWLDGDSITLEWKAADGTDATFVITSIISEDSDVDTIMLEWPHVLDDVPPGTEVTFNFSLRGGIEDAEPNPSKVTVTVLSDEEPTPTGDEPVLERGYSEGEGHSDGQVYPYYPFILQGEHLTDAEVKIGYVEGGTPREEVVPDEKLTVSDSVIRIASDCVELEDAINAGGVVTFTVTTPNGSASYEAEVQE